MGANLAKTPLLAVLYASLLTFAAALIPYSQSYAEARSVSVMPFSGYLLLIGYGLWVSLAAGILFSAVKVNAVSLLLLALSYVGLQWVAPNLQQLAFGQPTGIITGQDTLFMILSGATATIFLLGLCMMLLKSPDNKAAAKYKIKSLRLVIWLFVLPVIFMILYFITWYFLTWRNGAVREYYSPGAEDTGYIAVMINMLLTNARMVPFALLQGLLYLVLGLPLLLSMAGKRAMYTAVTIMLNLSGALWQLIPNAAVPAEVRMAQLVQYAVQLLVYGALCSVLLYTVLQKPAAEPRPAKAPVVNGRPAPRR